MDGSKYFILFHRINLGHFLSKVGLIDCPIDWFPISVLIGQYDSEAPYIYKWIQKASTHSDSNYCLVTSRINSTEKIDRHNIRIVSNTEYYQAETRINNWIHRPGGNSYDRSSMRDYGVRDLRTQRMSPPPDPPVWEKEKKKTGVLDPALMEVNLITLKQND